MMESLPFQPTFCVSSTLNASRMNLNLVDVRGSRVYVTINSIYVRGGQSARDDNGCSLAQRLQQDCTAYVA